MRFHVAIDGETREVELRHRGAAQVVTLDGEELAVDAAWLGDRSLSLLINGRSYDFVVETAGRRVTLVGAGTRHETELAAGAATAGAGHRPATQAETIVSPMPGKVVGVLVQPGERVRAGQGVVVVEAMKMENELATRADGEIRAVYVKPGQVVEGGQKLVEVGPCSS